MCLLSMGPTNEMMKKKNLSTLDPFFREGLVRTTGRVTAKSMMKHLQHESLVILSPSCRLSYLIMSKRMKKITDAPLVMHCFDQENMVSGLLKDII